MYFGDANQHYREKKFKEAARLYELAAKNKEVAPWLAYYNAGTTYLKQKNYKKGIDMLKKALVYKKDDDRIYYNIGYCYLKLFEYRKAYIYMNTYLSLNNNDKDAEKILLSIEKNLFEINKN